MYKEKDEVSTPFGDGFIYKLNADRMHTVKIVKNITGLGFVVPGCLVAVHESNLKLKEI